jgi:hypothetical protein
VLARDRDVEREPEARLGIGIEADVVAHPSAGVEVQLEAGVRVRLPDGVFGVEHELEAARRARERFVPQRVDDGLPPLIRRRRCDYRCDVEVAAPVFVRAERVRAARVDADHVIRDASQEGNQFGEVRLRP